MGMNRGAGIDGVVTFADVETAMVEAIELWRRSPGGDRGSPFAGDGPWQLMTREGVAGDYDARGGIVDTDGTRVADTAPPRMPLSRAEVGVRDAVSGWLELVQERDRRLVALAVNQMARMGYRSPAFLELRRAMGIALGADGLRKRYNRAVYGIASHLNSHANAREAAGLRR